MPAREKATVLTASPQPPGPPASHVITCCSSPSVSAPRRPSLVRVPPRMVICARVTGVSGVSGRRKRETAPGQTGGVLKQQSMQAARARTVVYSSLQAPATSAARHSVGASTGEQASTCRAMASISSRSTSYGKATRAQLGAAVWTGQQEGKSVVSLHCSPASQRSPGSAPPRAAPAASPWQLRPWRWEAAGRRWRQGGLSPWAAVCTPSPAALPGRRSGQPQRPASPDTREGTAEERPPVHVIKRTLRAFALRVALTPHLFWAPSRQRIGMCPLG